MEDYIIIIAIVPIILTLGMMGLLKHLNTIAMKEYEE
jgi:hypothetical protein